MAGYFCLFLYYVAFLLGRVLMIQIITALHNVRCQLYPTPLGGDIEVYSVNRRVGAHKARLLPMEEVGLVEPKSVIRPTFQSNSSFSGLFMPYQHFFLHTLTSLTLLWLGRASELSLLSKITLLPFGRDVTFRNVHQRCGQSTRNVTKDESIESELSMPRPSNVMEHNKY